MKVYQVRSNIPGFEDGLYVSMKVVLDHAQAAASKQGCFYRILENSPDVVHLTVVDLGGRPKILDGFTVVDLGGRPKLQDGFTYQDAIIRRIDIIEE